MTHSCPKSPLVILLLGETGVGKSTFINIAANSEVTAAGSELTSCTKVVKDFEVSVVTSQKQACQVILVDTPGFNDTWEGDAQIFEQIRSWLLSFSKKYPSAQFAGIVYLYNIKLAHNITLNGDQLITANMFQLPPLVTNLHFVATHCKDVNPDLALARENVLREKHWANMLENGAETSRFGDDQSSAYTIISKVVAKQPFRFSEVLNKFDEIHVKLKCRRPAHRRINGIFSRLFFGTSGVMSK